MSMGGVAAQAQAPLASWHWPWAPALVVQAAALQVGLALPQGSAGAVPPQAQVLAVGSSAHFPALPSVLVQASGLH